MKCRFAVVSVLLAAVGTVAPSLAADFTPDAMDSAAIQRAINAAHAAGGGRVALRAGVYKSGTIYLKSKVELHVPEGTVVLGSDKPEDYDDVEDPKSGLRPEKSSKAFIACVGGEDIALTGGGVIDGQGVKFYDTSKIIWEYFYAKPLHPRPRMVQFFDCRNVRMEGVTLKDSPGWTCWMRHCENVSIENVKIHGDQHMINNDGIDVDSCRKVRIAGCDLKTGDDCIVMRAMRSSRDNGVIPVCEDLLVENCTLDSFCQCIRLSCPSDGVIRRGVFRNLKMRGRNGVLSGHPLRYCMKGDKGYCVMEDLRVEDCDIDAWGRAISFNVEEGVQLRAFGNVAFRRVRIKSKEPLQLQGTKASALKNISMEDVSGTVEAVKALDVAGVQGLDMKGFSITSGVGAK